MKLYLLRSLQSEGKVFRLEGIASISTFLKVQCYCASTRLLLWFKPSYVACLQLLSLSSVPCISRENAFENKTVTEP